MAKRTISAVFYNYRDEDGRGATAFRGETVELSAEAIKRGEKFGAFAAGGPKASNALVAATGRNTRTQGGNPPSESLAGVVPSELTAEQIDSLSGDDLDNACEAAGIDVESGGSLANGALSADEKRAALHQTNG
jgi:hypothetical protein